MICRVSVSCASSPLRGASAAQLFLGMGEVIALGLGLGDQCLMLGKRALRRARLLPESRQRSAPPPPARHTHRADGDASACRPVRDRHAARGFRACPAIWRSRLRLTGWSLTIARLGRRAIWMRAGSVRHRRRSPLFGGSRTPDGRFGERESGASPRPCRPRRAPGRLSPRAPSASAEGIEQDRFAGARLAGEHGQRLLERMSSFSMRTMSRIDRAVSRSASPVG